MITSLLGIFIRSIPFLGFAVNSRYAIHAHSHVAFLGWVFIALMALIYDAWFSGCRKVMRWFLIYLGIIQVAVFGMLLTFPFTGYALWSIIFSSIHMVASIVFVFFFRKKSLPGNIKVKPFIRLALIFMAVSALGPLALGPLSASGQTGGILYDGAIYFYLHFQYNGWFTLAIIGLLLAMVDMEIIPEASKRLNKSLWFFGTGIILTYVLSLLGYRLPIGFNVVGGIGALLQLVGFFLIRPLINRAIQNIDQKFIKRLISLSLLVLMSKLVIQFLTSVPAIIQLTYFNRDFVIAFLHWMLLGFVSTFLLGLISYRTIHFRFHRALKASLGIYLISFLLTEAVLVGKRIILLETGIEVVNAGLLILSIGLGVSFFSLLIIVLKSIIHGSKPVA